MKRLYIFLLVVWGLSPFSKAHAQTTLALDNADVSQYAPQPNNNWATINGGFGYGTWTPIGTSSGGGTYMEGVGVNNRQVQGNYSFALYAGSGSYALSRPFGHITNGDFSILTRFDLAGTGPNLVNLRAGNDTTAFGNGELLSFGIVNGTTLCYTDNSGFHLLPSGEARGVVWYWRISFNAASGAYILSVTNVGGGFAAEISGVLEANGGFVSSFAVINSSAGANQNLIFGECLVDDFNTHPPPLSISQSGTNAVVNWDMNATAFYVLQSAPVVNGTNSGFADVPGLVTSGPYTNTNAASATFFRLRSAP